MTKLHRDDLFNATLQWVVGNCFEWNQHAKQFNPTEGHDFQDFCHRTHGVVWRYLNRQITLDGACSDFECNLGLAAHRTFGYHLEETNGQ